MEGRLHRRVLVPVLVVAVAAVGIGALAVAGGLPIGDQIGAKPKPTPSASAPASASPEACRPRFKRFPDDASRATWFTIDGQTDTNGVLIGNVARVTHGGGGPVVAIELPPEAWAEGPYDEGALVGSDDGLTSTLRFLAPRGCGRTLLTTSDEIIWRATISPDEQTLYTYRLARGTRDPLGVWMAPLADPTQSRQLIGPIPPDDRFGVTWGTALKWSAEGDRLVVESCSPAGCRMQIIEPSTGAAQLIDDSGLGDFVGLVDDRLFALSDCIDYRPCPLLERNLATGTQRELHPGVDDATLITNGKTRLIVTVGDGGSPTLQVIDPDAPGASVLPVPALLRGLTPVRNWEYGGIGLPKGWLALASEGRLPNGKGVARLFAIHVDSSRLFMLVGGN